jgi:hypothetical protein
MDKHRSNNRDDDGISTIAFCTSSLSLVGKYTKMLFDLKLDPFEMKNQFHNEDLEDIKVSVQEISKYLFFFFFYFIYL